MHRFPSSLVTLRKLVTAQSAAKHKTHPVVKFFHFVRRQKAEVHQVVEFVGDSFLNHSRTIAVNTSLGKQIPLGHALWCFIYRSQKWDFLTAQDVLP